MIRIFLPMNFRRQARRTIGAMLLALALGCFGHAADGIGADLPWMTCEAESMTTTGTVLGPKYGPFLVETESSDQRCVQLAAGEYVEFTAPVAANTLVIRYSLPDAKQGGGLDGTLELLVNGRPLRTLPITSRYSHLYGTYPFSNDPAKGKPRNYYDELRVKDLAIAAGDQVRLRLTSADVPYCIVDLADLEAAPSPLAAPMNALSVMSFGAGGKGVTDDTEAVRACIAAARRQGGVVWVPAGDYKLTGDIVVPSGVTIQGAGMWHTTFVGDAALYPQPARRVRFILSGNHIRLQDFAIVGRLNYRNDSEPNDGIVGAGCVDSSVARIWVEHTKVGIWIYNGMRLRIEGCRIRDTLADGVNLCVGCSGCVVENCSARGTGDDCFAIWPAPADQGFRENHRPGDNIIRHCTGQLPFLANGGALYGGANNRIEDCLFTDITAGCGILVSTTFPTSDEPGKVDNNFSGMTVVENCRLIRCGGYDHDWAWRGALQICLDRRSISGLRISQLEVRDSFSDGITVIAPGGAKGEGTLADTTLEDVVVSGIGLGNPPGRGLWVHDGSSGGLALIRSHIPEVRNDSGTFRILTQP